MEMGMGPGDGRHGAGAGLSLPGRLVAAGDVADALRGHALWGRFLLAHKQRARNNPPWCPASTVVPSNPPKVLDRLRDNPPTGR
jgi:hypothetical protein